MFEGVASKGAPSLPSWFLLPASAIFALVTLYVMMRTPGRASRYLIFGCWLRYTLSSLHQYTFSPAFGTVSYTALGSLFIIALGLVVLDVRRFFIWPFFPVLIICLLMVVSGVLNNTLAEAIEPIIRFLFFSVIAVATWQAVDAHGLMVFRRLLWTFLPAVVFQVASIVLGVTKSGEIDQSLSYIGGFYHEQQFSLVLATCFLIVSFATGIGRAWKFALSIISIVGIYLANYRTTILGIAPLVVAQVILGTPRVVRPSQRNAAFAIIGVVGAAALGLGVLGSADRFADVGTLLKDRGGIIRPPETFRPDERRLLSARPYIWSGYIYAYADGSDLQHFIGFGPDAWTTEFSAYAHNTVVSFLYELGVLGVLAIFFLWGSMLALALRVAPPFRSAIIAGHASFFLLNMATMPHWQIEGNIFYGVLCGYTISLARATARSAHRAARARVDSTPRASPLLFQ